MSKNDPEECSNCFFPFPRYARICPACRDERWEHWYAYIPPDPKTGKFHEDSREMIRAAGLSVIDADKVHEAGGSAVPVAPKERGLVLLVIGTGPGGSWKSVERPCGNTPVKPVGYSWCRTDREEDIPHEQFPPLSPDEARDKFFYEEACKPKGSKLPDKSILAKAKRLHPEWNCRFKIQWMRELADKHAKNRGFPKIERREYKRS